MTQKKLKSKSEKWIIQKLYDFAERENYWEHFYKFDCSETFKGETLAKLNKETYYKNMTYISRKIRQLSLLRRNLYGN